MGRFCLDFPVCIVLCLQCVAIQSPRQARYMSQACPHQSFHAETSFCLAACLRFTGIGNKCITCNAEFDTRHGTACHRRHPSSNGTACADPNSIRSVSITPRPDVSAGILRLHYSAPLGMPESFLNCTHPSEPTSSDL